MPEEIKPEVIVKTQKSLGKYVKKPQLSEKLLKKPPFRFLHDIINAVIKETGFLEGLFTSSELNSENVKEREAKIAFLGKLIDAIKIITKTNLAARPSKIVAGLEPTETNLLLQAIGTALEKKLDSSEYVKQLQSGEVPKVKPVKTKKGVQSTEKDKKSLKFKDEKPVKEKQKAAIETPKSTDRTKSKRVKENKSKSGSDDDEKKNKEKKKKNIKEAEKIMLEPKEDPIVESPQIIEHADTMVEMQEESKLVEHPSEQLPVETEVKKRIPSASRPKSARPKSGDLKEKQIESAELLPLSRPKSSLRPPSVRPSSARPGAPRLRPDSAIPSKEVISMGKINVIVENFDKDMDEEETVVIQSGTEVVEKPKEQVVDLPDDNKGHLVEQILEQINEVGDGSAAIHKKADIDWQANDLQGRGSIGKETANLRAMIQNMTKSANPLGKLLGYLHEDVDAMQAELEQWTNTKKQLFSEIAKQKKITQEMNKPLILQLGNLNEEIKKYENEIINTRSNILRNEAKIRELLAK